MNNLLVRILLAVIIFIILFANSSVSFAAPPANFESIQLISSGLNTPTAIEFAPDGRLFILEKGGAIKIYKNGQVLPSLFDELPVLDNSERGLLGIAFDPDFNSNHYVYFYYINLESKHYVVRLDASEDVGKNGPVTIWTSNVVTGTVHTGGTIQFGPDGKLYISIGEGGQSQNAQSLENPMGKILRINKDGSIPEDNPFVNDTGKRGEIWAYGLRNPFRFQFDKKTGELFVGDVGGGKWEEVNKIVKGGNYGWPVAEGSCSGCPFINPIYSYPHTAPSFSITGGLVYRGNLFPSEYQGRYFFGDYAQGFIKYLTFDQSGNQNGVFDFDTQVGTVVDLKTGPDGALYYLTIFPGKLHKITYTTGNKTPEVKAAADPTSGKEPLTVKFSSQGSSDPEGTSLSYLWEFGDDTSSTEANPSKTYTNIGKYTVYLTVSDGEHSIKSSPIEIFVGTPPEIAFQSPQDLSKYKAGDTINYAIVAKDSKGNELNQNNISFETIFHHDTHVHPFIRSTNSAVGNFVIPRNGEASSNTWYELKATATDENNLLSTKSINIYPQKTKFTLATNPPNYKLTIDGAPITTPLTIEGVVGFQREIDAPIQKIGDQYFEFDKWSDNGFKRHIITLPPSETTFTATFKLATPFIGEYFDNSTFTGPPVFTKEDSVIDFSWGHGSPDPKIPNDQFSIRWTKKQFFHFGRYKFSGHSDDGIRAYLDGEMILDGWGFNRGIDSIIEISEGVHDLRVDYREEGGGADVGFSWDQTLDQPIPTPSETPARTQTPTPSSLPTKTPVPTLTPTPAESPDAFTGEYFNNINLTGPPALTRKDEKINFLWHHASPDPKINKDIFSVRWTKNEQFTEGLYKFDVTADDGVRLFVDGTLLINEWKDQSSIKYSKYKWLKTGIHDIKLEYYESYGSAIADFSYSIVPPPSSFWKAEYFPNQNLNGTSLVTKEINTLKFVWDNGSPDPAIPNDHFSARYTKQQIFKAGTYKFTLKSDDGLRFYINNTEIVNDWTDHPLRTYEKVVEIPDGLHSLKVEYYENGGGAVVIFNQDY